jgi:serine/threonine protein kinase
MPAAFAFLRFAAKAALNVVGFGVGGEFAVEVLPEVAKDVWQWWGKDRPAEQLLSEVQEVAQLPPAEVAAQAEQAVAEVAVGRPETERVALTAYLSLIPAAIRQSQRRLSDPTGRTMSRGLSLAKSEDVLPFLPTQLPRFKPGDRPPGIGDWELQELLGAGGFGEVWKARNLYFDSVPPVALKFCLDPTAKDRLLRHEAAVLNQVMRQGRHPGIVPLQHTYFNADIPCLEYEYVAGGDLSAIIREARPGGGLPPRQAALIVKELAEAVGFGHRLTPPIVHRDLKPANILVQRSQDGKIAFRVADFGIGGVAAAQAIGQTRTGATQGQFLVSSLRGSYTLLYASAQQVRGDDPDPRDDVHALGVIWYQLLTAETGAGRPGGSGWKKRLAEKGTPAPLVDLLEECIEDNPADRPANASDLAERIAAIIDKKPPPAKGGVNRTPTAAPERPLSPQRVAILALVRDSKKGRVSRADVTKALGIESGFCSLLGHFDISKVEPGSLVGRGYLRVVNHGGEPSSYELTEEGREALKAAETNPITEMGTEPAKEAPPKKQRRRNTGTNPNDLVTEAQGKVLAFLDKNPAGAERKAIAEATGIHSTMIGGIVGYYDPEINSRPVHAWNLYNRGFVTIEERKYLITDAGRKALAALPGNLTGVAEEADSGGDGPSTFIRGADEGGGG